MKNNKRATNKKRRIPLTIAAALIGLGATIIGALIAVFGEFLLERPADPTQNADVNSITLTNSQGEFAEVLSVDANPGCYNIAYVMPSYIDPFSDINKAMSEFREAFERNEILQYAPDLYEPPSDEFFPGAEQNIPTGRVKYEVWLTNQASIGWIYVDNTVKLNINSQKITEGLVNTSWVGEGCGGEVEIRDFILDNNLLETNYDSYTLDATYGNENTYFKLAPGEFEIFTFTLQCGTPGIYQIEFEFPVNYQGKPGMISGDGGEFVCPALGAYWGPERLISRYEWNGSQYTRYQP